MRFLRSRRRLLLAVAGILAVVVGVILLHQQRSAHADYSPLVGRWIRPDGGYVLDIKSVSPNGKVEMVYLNPNVINVSKAQASTKEGIINLFIELRDVGYPGSYYTLTFNAERNLLVGVYHHLGIKQNFDVFFVKR